MLMSHKDLTYKSKFEESRKLLEQDQRYLVLSKRERQEIFEEHIRMREKRLMVDVKKMLSETQYVNAMSPMEGEQLYGLISVLREADIRFKRMDHMPQERLRLLKEFIKGLKYAGNKKTK